MKIRRKVKRTYSTCSYCGVCISDNKYDYHLCGPDTKKQLKEIGRAIHSLREDVLKLKKDTDRYSDTRPDEASLDRVYGVDDIRDL